MVRKAQSKVRAFHIRNNFKVDHKLILEMDDEVQKGLMKVALYCKSYAQAAQATCIRHSQDGDERPYRMHLMLEELAEVIEAMAQNDEVKLADGLGDLLYVLLGTAVTYSIPMEQVFLEIHNSNMSKKKRDPETNPRMRDKGLDYHPPNLELAIEIGRRMAK